MTQEAECTSFDALGLNQEIMGAVEELGYTAPTPVQAGAIPQVLEGRDVLAAALHAGVDHVAVGGIEGEHALSRGVVDRDGGLVAALVRHKRQHIGGVELRRNNAVFRLGTQIAHKAPFPEDIERRAADVVDRGGRRGRWRASRA